MRLSRSWLCAFFLALTALACWVAVPAQALTMSANGQAHSRDAALVIPDAEWLLGYDQSDADAQARRTNPASVEAREVSSSRFESLSAGQAARLVKSVFPRLVSQREGGLSSLPRGDRITGLVGEFTAAVSLPGGKRGAIQSTEPLAVQTGSGTLPVDLSLRETRSGYQPKRQAAGVRLRIPRRLSAGPSLDGLGISLTPIDSHGKPLSGATGVLDGNTVFYGKSERTSAGVVDTDTLVKPDTIGFSEETILRSERSPRTLHFRVGLPKGAFLRQRRHSHSVEVVAAGKIRATITAPTAVDAEGAIVPVVLMTSGNTLRLTVERRPRQFRFPIAVDPQITDYQLNASGSHTANWHFESNGSAFTAAENTGGGWTEHISGSHSSSEYGAFVYTTQGTSHITEVAIQGDWWDKGAWIQNELLIFGPSHSIEAIEYLPDEETATNNTWSREVISPSNNNTAEWLQAANNVGTGTGGENVLKKATVVVSQTAGPTAHWDTTDQYIGGVPNAMYGTSTWFSPHSLLEFVAEDSGMGISRWDTEYSNNKGIEYKTLASYSLITSSLCSGVQCPTKVVEFAEYNKSIQDGEVTFGVGAGDAGGYTQQPIGERRRIVKVDGSPPHNIVLTGLPSNGLVGLKSYTLKAEATDGTGTTPSSGVKTLALKIDGHEIGTASGSCSPGPCTAKSNAWTTDGHEYAAGQHLVTVLATDNAGNTETEDFTFTVRAASPLPLGPGEVDPTSGEFNLRSEDVSQGQGLTVTRSYRSDHLTAGVAGPLGPQWTIGMGNMESLEPQPEGGVVLTDDSGRQVIFASNGTGGFTAPSSDKNLALTFHEGGGVKEYILVNTAKGTSLRFTLPSGGGTLWMPTVQEGPAATGTPTEVTTYSYQTVEVAGKSVTRPIEMLAPVPSGVSCSPELKRGCMALTFNYATATTATGENESQWGDRNGNLTRVYLTAYDPASSQMVTSTVERYLYDVQGRLRTVWDPRVSPALKTFYGYDSENHVTAVTPPGRETFAFAYAQAPADLATGRIQRVTRAPATASLWGGSMPVNTAAPTLTPTEPALGVAISASTGTWNNSPFAYRYQWQRCNASGGECVAISGARNEAYKPTAVDAGQSLKIEVRATSGGGSVVAYSAAARVVLTKPSYKSKFGSHGSSNGQFNYEHGVALDGSGNVWVADTENDRVQEFNASGTFIRQFGAVGTGNGQFKEPNGIAVTPEGNVWVADTNNNRIQEFSGTGEYIRQAEGAGNLQLLGPIGIAVTPAGSVWVVDSRHYRLEEFSSTGEYVRQFGGAGSGNGQFGIPRGVALDAYEDIWVTDSTNNRVEEFSSTGTYMRQFGSEGTGNGQFKVTDGIAVDSTGKVWVTDRYGARVEGFNASGEYLSQYTDSAHGLSEPDGIAVAGSGTVYVADTGNQTIQVLNLSGLTPFSFSSTFSAYGGGVEPTAWQQDLVFDASGNVWVADALNNRIEEFNASGTYLKAIGSAGSGNGQLNTPAGLAFTSEGNVWVADTYNNRIEEFEPNGKYIRQFGSAGSGEGQFNLPRGIRIFPGTGYIAVADQNNNRIQVFNATGGFIREVKGSGSSQLSTPEALAIDAEGHLWVADAGHNRIEEFSSTGEYIRQFGSAGGGRGQFNNPSGLTVDGSRNVWVTDTFNNRLEGFTPTGEFLAEYGGWGSGNGQFYDPNAVAVSGAGVYYVLDAGWGRVQELRSFSEPAAAPSTGGAAMTTVAYGVPLSGVGAPQKMGSSEVAAWGQTDIPVGGLAIFPPDKPEGWPAPEADYKRATIYYFDEYGRTVNIASRAGGIATTEYNETNDVTRELSADNRVMALAEGAKSSEVSRLLDTQSTYSGDGTELLSELGPRHIVKLANGEEVLARQHTVYSYDEGAPEGGPYRLVTKLTEGAQIEGKAEQDVRTTTTFLRRAIRDRLEIAGTDGSHYGSIGSQIDADLRVRLDYRKLARKPNASQYRRRKPARFKDGVLHQCRKRHISKLWESPGVGESAVRDLARSSAGNERYPQSAGHYHYLQLPARARRCDKDGWVRYANYDQYVRRSRTVDQNGDYVEHRHLAPGGDG